MSATDCRRCGESTAAGCEDWDCHLGWGAPALSLAEATAALRRVLALADDLIAEWAYGAGARAGCHAAHRIRAAVNGHAR